MPDSASDSPCIVIGAGPAGLAVGACLQQRNVPCVLLEQSNKVGSSWHSHYDRLHLHTDKKNSQLPFLPYPGNFPRYPSRFQIIDYLENYARRFDLDIRFNQEVTAVRYKNGQWDVHTEDSRFQTPNVVVATGYNREPSLPIWPGRDSFNGILMHSSAYRNGERFRGQDVLVIGFGNSGGEIAVDLWEHGARVSLAVRNPVNVIPRELLGIPILTISILESKLPAPLADAINTLVLKAVIGDLTKYGLRKLPYGPMTQMRSDARIPLIDVGTIPLIRGGQIKVFEGVREFTETGVIFDDGKRAQFNAVILATGYRPRVNAFLEQTETPLCDPNGMPLTSGRETRIPGLYFCGFYVSATGMLREIAWEAKQISASIAKRYFRNDP